ncbi:MAG TPA: hypothetical protein VK730_12870 [Solirubrobacteraceae bacterium]|jgi:hypothetical protein|nr:hypothetical protein [Solirubrobacteraceae bacterium]
MSVSTEVQRTLVKSPPELWSEISNPEALARHLSELGEIRITAVEPETKVEWEAEGASGVVHLKQSGWGTKVTLSVTRTASRSEESPPEPEAIAEPVVAEPEPKAIAERVAAEPEPVAAEPEFEPEPVAAEPEPVAPVEPDPESSPAEPEPQLGFFARLFRRRKAKPVAVIEPEPEIEIEVVALAAPEPIYPEPPAEPEVDLAAELALVEAQMTAETTELLTGVLDRLGAAHHRPFSRG